MNGIRQRFIISLIFIVSLVFIFRLFQLQIFTSEYKFLAEQNIIQENIIFPSRGIVYDRNNKLIVENQPVYDIMVLPKEVKLVDTISLLKLFNLSKETLVKRLNKAKNYSYLKPSIFYKGIDNSEFLTIQQEIGKFPGFYIVAKTIRKYPNKILSHVMGYVGEISPEQLIKDTTNDYELGEYVGISGIEKVFEYQLKGIKGYEYKIHNVKGESVGTYKNKANDVIVKKGNNLVSSIDVNLQLYIEKLLNNKIGSVVAIEPSTGEILAIASSPSYDPNLLSGRFYSTNFNLLQKDSLKPLFNRSTTAMYPPGSIFKLINGLIALQEGVITKSKLFSCIDGYEYDKEKTIKCHPHRSPVNLITAIEISCNSYFCSTFEKYFKSFNSSSIAYSNWYSHLHSFGIGNYLNN